MKAIFLAGLLALSATCVGAANYKSEKIILPGGQEVEVVTVPDNVPLEVGAKQFMKDKANRGIAPTIDSLRKRLEQLEISEAARTKADAVNAYKMAELERKVAGMQKQITALHGKKADK